MFENLNDMKAEIGFHDRADRILLLRKSRILEGFNHLSAGKGSEVSSVLLARAVGILRREIGEIGTGDKPFSQLFGLGLFFRRDLVGIPGGLGYQEMPGMNGLRLFELILVLLVKISNLFVRDLGLAARAPP